MVCQIRGWLSYTYVAYKKVDEKSLKLTVFGIKKNKKIYFDIPKNSENKPFHV